MTSSIWTSPGRARHRLDCLDGRFGCGGTRSAHAVGGAFRFASTRYRPGCFAVRRACRLSGERCAAASNAIALNCMSVTPSLAYSTYHYDSTTIWCAPTSQAYRDRDVVEGAVTTARRACAAAQSAGGYPRPGSHYVAPQLGTPTRNSTGYQTLMGLANDADAVWRYRVLVGWEVRDFVASQYPAHQTLIARGYPRSGH